MQLLGQLFEGLSLGLGNEEGDEESTEHEEGENLHDVVKPTSGGLTVSSTVVVNQSTNNDLGDNSSDLTSSGRDTVGRRSVSGGEHLSGNNEGGGVGAKVFKELTQNVACKQTSIVDLVVSETDNTEESNQNEETSNLNGLSANGIDGDHRNPVSGNGSGTDKNQVTDGVLHQSRVQVVSLIEMDSLKNLGVVQTKTVEGNIQEEPRAGGTNENLSVLPLSEMSAEILEGSLGGA